MNRRSLDFHPALRIVHWLMAAMVLAMLFIGVGMVSTTGPAYLSLLGLHRPVGITILVLVLIRLPLRLATGAPTGEQFRERIETPRRRKGRFGPARRVIPSSGQFER